MNDEESAVELVDCPRCQTKDGLQIHRVGWYFVKCHNCEKAGDAVIGKACPERDDAITAWQNGELDGKLCHWG
jgi:ssDNA-binding Zn-finger/Zn-ribbon topoisomerase 1